MRYALVSPLNAVARLDSAVDPTVQTKAGWRWLPAPAVAPPAFDPNSQALVGPSYAVGADAVIESWMVRALTSVELDAVKDARISGADAVAVRIAFNHENRIRALEGQPSVMLAQFVAALKALL